MTSLPRAANVQSEIMAQIDIQNEALSKASGIMFIWSQVKDAELESEEQTNNAIWAVRDFLWTAKRAMHRIDALNRQLRDSKQPEA